MGPDGLYSLYSIAQIIGMIVTIFVLVYFFQMASDIRKIRSLLAKQVEGYDPEESESGKGQIITLSLAVVAVVLAIVLYFIGK